MAEMNRRTLAFRGGGVSAAVAAGNNNNNNGVSSEEEASAWALGRQLNGGGGGGVGGEEEEVEVELEPEGLLEDDEEDGEAYPGATKAAVSVGGVTGPSVSGDSSEEDEDDEEEEDEDGGKAVEGDEDCTLIPGGGGDGPRRFGLLPSTRPQSLLPSLHCSFQGSWLHEFPWLRFSQENGLMSCTWCHSDEQAGHDELTKGTRSYKRALLLRHGQTTEHRLNDPAVQVRPQPGRGGGALTLGEKCPGTHR